jgi:hypothetical protein
MFATVCIGWRLARYRTINTLTNALFYALQVQSENSEKRKDHQNYYDDYYQAKHSDSSLFVSLQGEVHITY